MACFDHAQVGGDSANIGGGYYSRYTKPPVEIDEINKEKNQNWHGPGASIAAQPTIPFTK